jgi:hypothetical protein
VGKAEVQRRLDHADKLLRDGKARADVVDSMVRTFGVSTRAADSYIAKVRERWAEESKGTRDVDRSATLARLDRISGKAENRGAFGAAVSAEKLRAQVTGLLVPQAVEVKATIATAAAPDENLSDAAIAEELSAIASLLGRGGFRRGRLPLPFHLQWAGSGSGKRVPWEAAGRVSRLPWR